MNAERIGPPDDEREVDEPIETPKPPIERDLDDRGIEDDSDDDFTPLPGDMGPSTGEDGGGQPW